MNKKLAIFGFSILWITAIAAIVFILVPKLSSNKDFNAKKLQANELGIIEDDNSLFYDKKALVRHKNTDADSFNATKKAMVIRKNIFFTLPVKPSSIRKEAPKKIDNSNFDIKPVPKN